MKSATPVDAFAALRVRDFRFYALSTFLYTIALLIQEVVIGYELYRLTKDPLVLGLVGLAEALPYMALALFGGVMADRFDKKNLILSGLTAMFVLSVCLVWLMKAPALTLLWQVKLYGCIALMGLIRGLMGPAYSALKPFLVPRELYGNASTWSSSSWQAGAILGPVVAGFLYAKLGLETTLEGVLLLLALVWLCQASIARKPIPAQGGDENVWQSLKEGWDFVKTTPIILYSISLDLVAVLFGGVVAILPIFAEDILKVGPEGLGFLRAAPSVGALLTMVICAWLPPTDQLWRNLLWAVVGFGVATLVFAVSKLLWLSMLALFFTGVFDSISVIIRQTIMAVFPPDHLRGRVVAVNSIFISASNELGAFESGVAAKLLGTVRSVVAGGVATLLLAAWVRSRTRELLSVRLAS